MSNILNKLRAFFSSKQKTIKFSIAVFLAVLICFFLFSNLVDARRDVVKSSSYSLDASNFTYYGYFTEDGKYIPNSNDPQIHITGASGVVNDFCITFNEPLKDGTRCQLFYLKQGGQLSEATSFSLETKHGQDEVYFSLPGEAVYPFFRLDVDGEFSIKSVEVSVVTSSVEYSRVHVDIAPMIISAIAIAIAIVVAIFYEEKVIKAYSFVKSKLFSADPLDPDFEKKRSTQMANTFMIIALLGGGLLAVLTPPLAFPDEQAHFFNVLRLSHFQILPTARDGQLGALLQYDEILFLKRHDDVYNAHMSWDLFTKYQMTSNRYATIFFASKYANLNPFSYVISGFAVAIFRFFNHKMTVHSMLIVARLANLVFATLVTRYAIKSTPVFKNTMFLLALMPMTIQQFSSTNYDAILIPCAFLLFAWAMKIILADKDYKITIKDIVVICLSFLGCVVTKFAYAIVALIFLAISIKKFGSLKKWFTCIGLIASIFVVFYTIPTALASNVLSDSQSAVAVASEASATAFSISQFIEVLSSTVEYFSDPWKEQFFGLLGWLTINFPRAISALFYMILIPTFIIDASFIKGINIRTRILSFLVTTGFYIGTVYFMYVELGTFSGNLALGIQGRYFIPVILFLFLIIANPLLSRFKYSQKIVLVQERVAYLLSSFCVLLTVFAIFSSYWL